MLLFYPYIARQAAKPVQLIMEKINKDACKYGNSSRNDDVFAGSGVHISKLTYLKNITLNSRFTLTSQSFLLSLRPKL